LWGGGGSFALGAAASSSPDLFFCWPWCCRVADDNAAAADSWLLSFLLDCLLGKTGFFSGGCFFFFFLQLGSFSTNVVKAAEAVVVVGALSKELAQLSPH
jgi:hypothetical protein